MAVDPAKDLEASVRWQAPRSRAVVAMALANKVVHLLGQEAMVRRVARGTAFEGVRLRLLPRAAVVLRRLVACSGQSCEPWPRPRGLVVPKLTAATRCSPSRAGWATTSSAKAQQLGPGVSAAGDLEVETAAVELEASGDRALLMLEEEEEEEGLGSRDPTVALLA